MPIGQLLASITGEKPATPLPPPRPQNGIPVKRKADEDVKGSAQKAPKTTMSSARPSGVDASKTSRPADRSSSGYAGSARPTTTSTTNSPRPLAEKSASSASKKPISNSNGKPSPTSTSFSSNARSAPPSALAKRSAPPATASADQSSKAPKKGSIAEIKARAAAQQEKLLAIGKIQHKATEKPLTKKEREEAAAEEAKAVKKGLKPGMRLGLGGLPSRAGPGGTSRSGTPGHVDRARGAIQKPSGGKSPTKAALVEERKVKKAAVATTGYTGSARPKPKAGPSRPGVSGSGRNRERSPNPLGMFKPRRGRDEEYDEELDDFIDDDDEQEDDGYGYGSRYRYADEDDDSDMEAGYSDVEDEEEAAMKYARQEDAREQAILEQRKREKEARKKGLVSARR